MFQMIKEMSTDEMKDYREIQEVHEKKKQEVTYYSTLVKIEVERPSSQSIL